MSIFIYFHESVTGRPTDGLTNGQTYRYIRSHKDMHLSGLVSDTVTLMWSIISIFPVFDKCVTRGQTDGRPNGQTEGQTDHLILMQERI